MMDMMTIILVFLLKSFASSSAAITASEDVRPPVSSTRASPKDTVAITITPKNILVGDKEVVRLKDGHIPEAQLQGRLVAGLDAQLKKEVAKLKYIEERNPAAPFTHELSVIADKMVPYDLLLTVLYTAGENELRNYRFIVLQRDAE
jgi:biopolymer transport protein ExbD